MESGIAAAEPNPNSVDAGNALAIRAFGPLSVECGGTSLKLPNSRKTRALLGYLLLAPRPVSRSRLCELLFDVPDDPRGALRWSLSKLRVSLDAGGRRHLITDRDRVGMDLSGISVDILEFRRRLSGNLDDLATHELDGLLDLRTGPLLADAELPDRAEYSAWLAAVRAEFHFLGSKLIDELLRRATSDPARMAAILQRRLQAADFDEEAYSSISSSLSRVAGRGVGEAELRDGQKAGRSGQRSHIEIHQNAAVSAPALPNLGLSRRTADMRDTDTRPVVAVLPFTDLNMESLPAQFVAGLQDVIIHTLSRFRSIQVLSRSATSQISRRLEDPVQLGSSLGATILVGGSLARGDDRIRVRWRVVETRRGRLVTTGELACELQDATARAGEAAERIAVATEPYAQFDALERALRKFDGTTTAHDLHLQGLYGPALISGELDYVQAVRYFRRALEAEPSHLPSAAFLPWASFYAALLNSDQDRIELQTLAQSALRGARDDARVLAVAASALAMLAVDQDASQAAIEKAIALNSFDHFVWSEAGCVFMANGDYERAVECLDQAHLFDTTGLFAERRQTCRAFCSYLQGDIDEADRLGRKGIDERPDGFWNLVLAAATAVDRDDLPRARSLAPRIISLSSGGLRGALLSALPFRQIAQRKRLTEALAIAGV